jgi:hypothetical protein
MVTHDNARSSITKDGGCSVALLESYEVHDEDYTHYMSVGEITKYKTLPSQHRKNEWLASRLAAKYLFLDRLDMSNERDRRQGRPTLLKLTSERLRAFSPWMYQKVEVLLNDGTASRYAKLVWCGKDRPENISISHAGGMSCACLAVGHPAAVDIECAIPRIESFYRHNFTAAERQWATLGDATPSLRSEWLFTLLWSLKESALKLGWLKSLWNVPRIEIEGLPDINQIGQYWFTHKMNDEFDVFTARVTENCRVLESQVAITGTSKLILAVMNPFGGLTT